MIHCAKIIFITRVVVKKTIQISVNIFSLTTNRKWLNMLVGVTRTLYMSEQECKSCEETGVWVHLKCRATLLTWWYLANCRRMPSKASVAVLGLNEYAAVATTLGEHLTGNVVQGDPLTWRTRKIRRWILFTEKLRSCVSHITEATLYYVTI